MKKEIVLIVICVIASLIPFTLRRKLPEKVTVQFKFNGEDSTIVPKSAALAIVPLICFFTYLLPLLTCRNLFWIRLILVCCVGLTLVCTIVLANTGHLALTFWISIPTIILSIISIIALSHIAANKQ